MEPKEPREAVGVQEPREAAVQARADRQEGLYGN